MNDTIEILKAARQLIEKREDWWELKRADYPTAWEECYGELLNALPPTWRRHGLATYNYTHSHEDVLALFDRAIAASAP